MKTPLKIYGLYTVVIIGVSWTNTIVDTGWPYWIAIFSTTPLLLYICWCAVEAEEYEESDNSNQ